MKTRKKVGIIYRDLLAHGTDEAKAFALAHPIITRIGIRFVIDNATHIAKVRGVTEDDIQDIVSDSGMDTNEEVEALGLDPFTASILIAILTEVAKLVISWIYKEWVEE